MHTGSIVGLLLEIALVVAAFRAMASVRSTVSKGQVSQQKLVGNTKVEVVVLVLASPILAQAIFYYGWKKQLPAMARSANLFGWLSIVLWIVLLFVGHYVTGPLFS